MTLEVELSPLPDDQPYILVVSARIGNVKFEAVPYCITIQRYSHSLPYSHHTRLNWVPHSEHPLQSAVLLPTNVPDLIKTMINWLRLHYDTQRVCARILSLPRLQSFQVLESSLYALCHLSHFKENRPRIADAGGITLLCDIIKDYMTEWQMLKEVLSLVWDMSCDLGNTFRPTTSLATNIEL